MYINTDYMPHHLKYLNHFKIDKNNLLTPPPVRIIFIIIKTNKTPYSIIKHVMCYTINNGIQLKLLSE